MPSFFRVEPNEWTGSILKGDSTLLFCCFQTKGLVKLFHVIPSLLILLLCGEKTIFFIDIVTLSPLHLFVTDALFLCVFVLCQPCPHCCCCFFFLLVVFACLSVCSSACLSVCLSACLPFCLSVCLPFCLSVCLSVCLPFCLFVCLPAFLSVCLPFCLSVCQSVCQSAANNRGKRQ